MKTYKKRQLKYGLKEVQKHYLKTLNQQLLIKLMKLKQLKVYFSKYFIKLMDI